MQADFSPHFDIIEELRAHGQRHCITASHGFYRTNVYNTAYYLLIDFARGHATSYHFMSFIDARQDENMSALSY